MLSLKKALKKLYTLLYQVAQMFKNVKFPYSTSHKTHFNDVFKIRGAKSAFASGLGHALWF